jgi:hypothetical protein
MKTLVIGQTKTGKTEYCVNKIQDHGKVLYFSNDCYSIAQTIDIANNDNLIFKTEIDLELMALEDLDLIIVDYNSFPSPLTIANIKNIKCNFIITYNHGKREEIRIFTNNIFDRLVRCYPNNAKIISDKYNGYIEE